MPQKSRGRKKSMAKSKARRPASSKVSSKPKSLKSYRLFSPITLIIVVVLVIMAALVSAFQTGGNNAANAAAIRPVTAIGSSLAGYVQSPVSLTSAPTNRPTISSVQVSGGTAVITGIDLIGSRITLG